MRIHLIAIAIALTAFGSELAEASQNAQIQFNEANQLFEESRYSEALDHYLAIEASGSISGPLFLNMGIAATRLDSMGLAKVYFMKAQSFREVERAAVEGLSFVSDELGRRGARLPELTWISISNHLYFDTNYTIWLIVGVLLFNIGGVLLVAHWLRQRYRTLNKITGISLMATGFLILILSITLSHHAKNYAQAVQITREAQVHQMPNADSDIVQTGFEGFEYIVNRKESLGHGEWLRVRMSNGSNGWIRWDKVRKL